MTRTKEGDLAVVGREVREFTRFEEGDDLESGRRYGEVEEDARC